MLKLFYRAKRLKKKQRSSPTPVYTAFLSIVLCMVCLAGTTWAWFTANQTAGIAPITSAQYAVDVVITSGAETLTGTSEGNMRFFTLAANDSYTVTLTPTKVSTASTGYCLVSVGDTIYYTSAITQESSFSFTYQTGVAVYGLTASEYKNLLAYTEPTNLTVAWYWGEYPNTLSAAAYGADAGYTLLKDGAILGTAPGEAPIEVELTLDLTEFDLSETDEVIPVGEDYSLVLTPCEGYGLPEYIVVEIDGTAYEVYTDGLEHREIPVDAEGDPYPEYLDENGEPDPSLLPPMPTFDPETNTLTIPASLLTEETKSVRIEAAAVEIEEPECICETKCTERNEDCPVCRDGIDGCTGTEVTEPTDEPTPTEEPESDEETTPAETAAPVETEPPAETEETTTPTETATPEETETPTETETPAATDAPTPVETNPPETAVSPETTAASEETTEPTPTPASEPVDPPDLVENGME